MRQTFPKDRLSIYLESPGRSKAHLGTNFGGPGNSTAGLNSHVECLVALALGISLPSLGSPRATSSLTNACIEVVLTKRC